jgi:hypothetical protein
MRPTRRQFLGYAASGVIGTRLHRAHVRAESESRSARISRTIEQYDAQGDHRTGTAADRQSADWLLEQVREYGVAGALEPFVVNRLDPRAAFLQVGDEHRVEGVPLFDGTLTEATGIRGRLGAIGSDAEVGLVSYETVTGEAGRRLAEVRRTTRHRALVVVTKGGYPGLSLINAPDFMHPFGPPVLQVASTEEEPLNAAVATGRTEVAVTAHAMRTSVEAFNVTARIDGLKPEIPPLMVLTPRTGWWHCAAERGGGLACWLEVLRSLRGTKPARSVLFVASSGHELGYLGIIAWLERRSGFATNAHAWIVFGANVGAATEVNTLLQASDDQLDMLATDALMQAGVPVNRRTPRGEVPAGETSAVHRAGARYVSILGANPFFHNPADRWPASVNVGLVDQHAQAFIRVADRLSRT